MPATLSIITNVFPARERGKAIGVWAGTAGLAGVLGPLTGGFLLEHFYWGSIFLVNIPIVIVGAARRRLPDPHVEGPDGAEARPGRRGAVDRRARRAALRHHRGAVERLDRPHDRRRASSSARRAARRLLRVGAPHRPPDARRAVLQEPALHRREHRRSRWCSSRCSARSSCSPSTSSSCSATRRSRPASGFLPWRALMMIVSPLSAAARRTASARSSSSPPVCAGHGRRSCCCRRLDASTARYWPDVVLAHDAHGRGHGAHDGAGHRVDHGLAAARARPASDRR